MTFKIPERLYKTTDGRLVRHGDPEAAFLAFPAGHELSEEEAQRWGVTAFYAAVKARSAPVENKMATAPSNKSAPRVDPGAVKTLTSKGSET